MKQHYFPSINMLRGVAALMVCLYHFTTYTDHRGSLFDSESIVYQIGEFGLQGVFVFFVITGFVIPLSLLKKDFQWKQFPKFLAKRWVRIEIPYVFSIISILLMAFLFSLNNGSAFEFKIGQFFHHLVYTVPFSEYDWYNTIYWTLAIEMQFYIIIALIYPLIASKHIAVRHLIMIVFGISGFFVEDHRIVFYYAPIFVQGLVLLLIKMKRIDIRFGLIYLLGFSALTFFTHGVEIGVVSAITVAVIALPEIDKKVFNRLGDISYSLYLMHGLIGGTAIYFLSRFVETMFAKIALVLLATTLSIVGSYIYWRLIENPSKKLSKRIKL